MIKYNLLKDRLLYKGIVNETNFLLPTPIDFEILELTHTKDYVRRTIEGKLTETEIRRIGFPYSKKMVERELLLCGAMVQATQSALNNGISFNMGGGTHHAFANYGSAYCIFNDIAVAAKLLLNQNQVKKILIIDLDVHQGNGTASIFNNNSHVFTFSIHGKSVFPLKKQQSTIDIELQNNTTDDVYLKILKNNLQPIVKTFKPQIALYQSGVDLLGSDKLGKQALSLNGLKERDKFVFEICLKNNIPIATCIGGGYASDINIITEAHCNTIIAAKEVLYKIKKAI